MRPEDSLVLEVASDGLTSVVDGDGVHGSSAVLTPTGAARDRGVAVAEWSHCDTKTRGTSASRSKRVVYLYRFGALTPTAPAPRCPPSAVCRGDGAPDAGVSDRSASIRAGRRRSRGDAR